MTSWAAASLGYLLCPFWESISGEGLSQFTYSALFPVQSLSNLAWACSLSFVSHLPLRQALSAASLRMLREFVTFDRSNPAWSNATLAYINAPLRTALASASIRR